MKIICNSLYRNLVKEEYYKDIQFLSNEECDENGEGYDLSEVELAVLQPFYVNKNFLDRMPNLKYVQITGAGYDRVDIEEIKKRNLIMCNTRGVMSVSIAEDVFSKMLFFSREMRVVEEDKKEHKWNTFGQDQWMCSCYVDLYGKNLGIMGYGSVGQEISKRAKTFGMNIYVYDVMEQKDTNITECFIGEESLQKFYSSCDYIVVCIPLNDKTRHMISTEAFEEMKDSAILINVARGPLVDTEALMEALHTRRIRGAALDVFEQEPLARENPLWDVENLFMSSHKAGMGDSWKGFIGDLIMRNIDHYKNKNLLENRVKL